MTSVVTNTSSMAALQTLRALNSGLDETRQQVSSGLRVESAADNVAYWSISTTMKSDNRANAAADDALGVGRAKVDVAIAGLDQVIDIVSDFRAKLVTASETSVDREKIQDELEQLKTQLVAVSTSASFSGVNWLSTSVEDNLALYSVVPDDLVSGFIRDADGSVRVATTQVDTANISVFNTGGGGALEEDIRSLGDIGGFRNAQGTFQSAPGVEYWEFSDPVTLGASDSISFDLSVDGGTATSVTIAKSTIDSALGTSDGTIDNASEYMRVLNQALQQASLSGIARAVYNGTDYFGIMTREATGSTESSIGVTNVSISLTPPPTPASDAGGFIGGHDAVSTGGYASSSILFSGPFRVYRDVAFSFDVSLPDKTVKTLSIDRDRIDSILGTSDGWVNTSADLITILNAAQNTDGDNLASAGIIASDFGGSLQFTIDGSQYPDKGARSWFAISNIKDNVDGADFNILDVDITDPSNSLNSYIDGLDKMLRKVIKGGASLGAAKARLEMQETFERKLMDNIDSGISRLVDTDMEEASAKLAALQTQQQLSLQSLQIANTSGDAIMQLFASR